VKMQKDTFMSKKIKEGGRVKVVFRSDVDSSTHVIRGEMLDENEDFFYVENFVGDSIPIHKGKIISMIFQKSKDPKPEIESEQTLKKQFKKGQKFSYSKWWGDDHIKEEEIDD